MYCLCLLRACLLVDSRLLVQLFFGSGLEFFHLLGHFLLVRILDFLCCLVSVLVGYLFLGFESLGILNFYQLRLSHLVFYSNLQWLFKVWNFHQEGTKCLCFSGLKQLSLSGQTVSNYHNLLIFTVNRLLWHFFPLHLVLNYDYHFEGPSFVILRFPGLLNHPMLSPIVIKYGNCLILEILFLCLVCLPNQDHVGLLICLIPLIIYNNNMKIVIIEIIIIILVTLCFIGIVGWWSLLGFFLGFLFVCFHLRVLRCGLIHWPIRYSVFEFHLSNSTSHLSTIKILYNLYYN